MRCATFGVCGIRVVGLLICFWCLEGLLGNIAHRRDYPFTSHLGFLLTWSTSFLCLLQHPPRRHVLRVPAAPPEEDDPVSCIICAHFAHVKTTRNPFHTHHPRRDHARLPPLQSLFPRDDAHAQRLRWGRRPVQGPRASIATDDPFHIHRRALFLAPSHRLVLLPSPRNDTTTRPAESRSHTRVWATPAPRPGLQRQTPVHVRRLRYQTNHFGPPTPPPPPLRRVALPTRGNRPSPTYRIARVTRTRHGRVHRDERLPPDRRDWAEWTPGQARRDGFPTTQVGTEDGYGQGGRSGYRPNRLLRV